MIVKKAAVKAAFFHLQAKLQSHKICAWECRAVNVAGVTQSAFVEIVLIAVENILHATVDLQRRTNTKRNVVS